MSGPRDDDAPSLEQRESRSGKLAGDRYVRIVRPKEFRRESGHFVATEDAIAPTDDAGRFWRRVRRTLLGRPISSESEVSERVSKKTGLAILASDNISSSAYATEEAMRVLALAGSAALALTMPIALGVVAVLAIVVLSESRVIRAYPNGGGSYIVARENLGTLAGLAAAAALLIDYVLTVAVSSAAGIAALSSFVPWLHDHRALAAISLVGLLMIGNLRGVREAGLLFALPTYAYVGSLGLLITVGLARVLSGDVPVAPSPPVPFEDHGTMALTTLLVLRAFASGSVGLTGSEAVANGVPNFKPPEPRNAVITLLLMGGLFSTIFLGITYLATTIGVQPDHGELETVNSMLTRAVFGPGTPLYYLVQITTAVILLLAANTGFTGFPRLASILANDRFMPRQFAIRGDRLAFSFGIVVLAVTAAVVLWAFRGSVTALIPLYTLGVFVAFTLSQSGLVRRWWRLRNRGWRLSILINAIGAAVTGTVLVVVAVTKFEGGAWMVLVVMPLIVSLLLRIHRHYRSVADALVLTDLSRELPELGPPVVVVPIARLDRAAVRAMAFARSISPHVRAVHISYDEEGAAQFRQRWDRWGGGAQVKLDVIESPFRSLRQPLLKYIERIDETDQRAITVVITEFVPRSWWEFVLHSQTALRLKAALLFRPNTIVVDVPYHFEEAARETVPAK
ncbi:MAG: APC family permease [Chloroflexi bacterium]|nr:APC family permease [Chloroflexota bacterium]